MSSCHDSDFPYLCAVEYGSRGRMFVLGLVGCIVAGIITFQYLVPNGKYCHRLRLVDIEEKVSCGRR